MQIFMNGEAKKDFSPDSVRVIATFNFRAKSYDEALRGGVEKVKGYIRQMTNETDFSFDDFKTRAYSVRECFHTNRLEPKNVSDLNKNLQQQVSDGFFFNQYVYLEFDYDRERLAKLLVLSSKIPNAPRLQIDFAIKDVRAKQRELIAVAYEDAKQKAEALANAAQKNLRDCVRVEIDPAPQNARFETAAGVRRASLQSADFEDELKNIDETFNPDDITISKQISCVWETSN